MILSIRLFKTFDKVTRVSLKNSLGKRTPKYMGWTHNRNFKIYSTKKNYTVAWRPV